MRPHNHEAQNRFCCFAEKGAVASAAELAREEERAKDGETSEASTSEEAAEEEAFFEAFTSPSKRESDQGWSTPRIGTIGIRTNEAHQQSPGTTA